MHVLPRIRGYKIFEEVVQLSNGELSKKFVYIYNDARGDAFRERVKAEAAKRQVTGQLNIDKTPVVADV